MKPALLVLNLQVPAHLEQMAHSFPDFDVLYAPEADQCEAAIAADGARVQAVCTIGATGLSAAQNAAHAPTHPGPRHGCRL